MIFALIKQPYIQGNNVVLTNNTQKHPIHPCNMLSLLSIRMICSGFRAAHKTGRHCSSLLAHCRFIRWI